MKTRISGDPFTITHTLQDGESDQFIRCKIYSISLIDVTSTLSGGPYVFLSHIANGLYGNPSITNVPDGQYLVISEVFRDALYEKTSYKYGIVEEDYRVTMFEDRIKAQILSTENNITETVDLGDGEAV